MRFSDAHTLFVYRGGLTHEECVTTRVDTLALDVEDIVVREHVLACVKIQFLDALLRLLKRARYHRIINGFILGNLEGAHDALDDVGCEYAHERIFERDEELCLPRVSLSPAATAELIVDAARLVPLGPDQV